MKFRKIVSAISALAMSASLFGAFATVGEAATTFYSENFENGTVGTWTSISGSISVAADTAKANANTSSYILKNGGASGSRTAGVYPFTTAPTSGIYRVNFDVRLDASNSSQTNTIRITGAKETKNWFQNQNGAIFYLEQASSGDGKTLNASTYTVNGTDNFSGAATSTEEGSFRDTSGWMNVNVIVNLDKKTSSYTIKKISTNATLLTGTYTFTTSQLLGIETVAPKTYGGTFIDNIVIEQLAAPAFTLSADEAELKLNEATTITVTDIVGDVSVSSGDSTIATAVYESGTITITGLTDGSAVVTVTSTSDGITETKEIIVRVGSAAEYTPEITSIKITGDDITGYAELQPATTYTAVVLDQREAEMPGENIVWSVSPADSGVTVEDGVVTVATTTAAGTYTVTATSVTNNSISASKNVTVKNVRDITYSGIDMITPFGGYVSESTETGISKQQIQGETIVVEYDIYVPTGTSSSFTFYNNGNLGTQYIFNDSDGDGWVTMQYVTGSSGAFNINSSDAYTKFKTNDWVHVKLEIPVTGNPGLGDTTVSFSDVHSNDPFNQDGKVRYPKNDRTISARNLGSRALNKIVYSGTATVTNLAMYTKAANVTVDAPNATVSGIEEGYIAQNTYTATVAADLGYEVTGVTVDGEAVTANEDGTYSIVVDADGAAIVVTTTALENTWVFEEVDFSLWENANIFFTYNVKAEDDSVSSTTTDGILFTEFLTTYTTGDNDLTQFSGEGEINFAIVVLEDAPGYELTDVYLKQPQATAAFMSGEFEADAEINESEYLELDDDMSFDVE